MIATVREAWGPRGFKGMEAAGRRDHAKYPFHSCENRPKQPLLRRVAGKLCARFRHLETEGMAGAHLASSRSRYGLSAGLSEATARRMSAPAPGAASEAAIATRIKSCGTTRTQACEDFYDRLRCGRDAALQILWR
jgi:hypothetical protein